MKRVMLTAFFCGFLLMGCGQSGRLYMPDSNQFLMADPANDSPHASD